MALIAVMVVALVVMGRDEARIREVRGRRITTSITTIFSDTKHKQKEQEQKTTTKKINDDGDKKFGNHNPTMGDGS